MGTYARLSIAVANGNRCGGTFDLLMHDVEKLHKEEPFLKVNALSQLTKFQSEITE